MAERRVGKELVNPHPKRGHGTVPSRPLRSEGRPRRGIRVGIGGEKPTRFQDHSQPGRLGFRCEEVGRVRPPSLAAFFPSCHPPPVAGGGEWLVGGRI